MIAVRVPEWNDGEREDACAMALGPTKPLRHTLIVS